MKLLDRMVLSSFIKFSCLALASFGGIYLLIEFFERVDNFLENHAALELYFLYFLNKIPVIVSQLMPLAILMGAFMTMASLSRHGELTAIFSSGVSLFGVIRPILGLALFISFATLAFNEFLLPIHVRQTNYIFQQQVKGKRDLTVKLSGLWFREGNAIINIRVAEPVIKTLSGVHVYRVNESFHITSTLEAKQAVFREGHWIGDSVLVRHFDPLSSELLQSETGPDMDLGFSKNPEEFRDVAARRDEMNFAKLWSLSHQLKKEGYDATSYEVDMHSRLSTPFACLITAFLGIPFALRGSRRSGLALGVVVSVGIGITYYFLNAILVAFGYSAVLPPLVAAWGANVLFSLLGLYLLLSKQG